MEFNDVVFVYKKYIEPFIALFVLIGLIYSGFMGYENYQAKKNIASECGWSDEDVRCWCEKGYVVAAENRMIDDIGEMGEVIFDVPFGG